MITMSLFLKDEGLVLTFLWSRIIFIVAIFSLL